MSPLSPTSFYLYVCLNNQSLELFLLTELLSTFWLIWYNSLNLFYIASMYRVDWLCDVARKVGLVFVLSFMQKTRHLKERYSLCANKKKWIWSNQNILTPSRNFLVFVETIKLTCLKRLTLYGWWLFPILSFVVRRHVHVDVHKWQCLLERNVSARIALCEIWHFVYLRLYVYVEKQ